jgi:hypothetical protein
MTEKKLEKAKLIELQEDLKTELTGGKKVDVQFNPDTLKVTYANQVVQPEGGNQAGGTAGRQFVGEGTTKLALTLWFDVTAMTANPVDDVRRLTKNILHFMTPKPFNQEKTKWTPPGTRFSWGSFIFDGMIEGMEESLEFFSSEGKPLRASISLTMSQQKILVSKFEGEGAAKRPGTREFAKAKQGDTLQGMAAGSGKGGDWQGIAEANKIEDPLRMDTGQFVDLNLSAGISSGAAARVATTTLSTSGASSFSLGTVLVAPKLPQLGSN